jgi:hypothetical protein
MGQRRVHHYVPRFYIKRFSINNDGKHIGLYNYRNNVFITNASLKHQACEPYLYGRDDEVEAELAKLENSIAKMFYYWTEEKILIPPHEGSNGYALLKRFILYQLFRTPKAGYDLNNIITDAFHTLIGEFEPEEVKKFSGTEVVHSDPVLLALLNSADKEHLLGFLSCKFIVNLSLLPFICSDAPVVMYNQLMEQIGIYTGATSLIAQGLQVFYPIHPRLMICLYDPKVYSCDGNVNCISTELIEDVHQLNAIQYINSNSQLFFNEFITKDYVEDLVASYGSEKRKPRPVNQIIKADGKNYFFSSFKDPPINLNLSFFRINKLDSIRAEIAPIRHISLLNRQK